MTAAINQNVNYSLSHGQDCYLIHVEYKMPHLTLRNSIPDDVSEQHKCKRTLLEWAKSHDGKYIIFVSVQMTDFVAYNHQLHV